MQNEKDLAARILVNARAGKGVRLTPDTAYFVGLKLMTASEKPTLAEIVAVLCDSKCSAACYPCSGKANIICRAYGHSVDETRRHK
jgi:hypothetical protein